MVSTKMVLKRNKEGLLVGASVGAAMAYYLKTTGANFLFAAQSPGLIDQFMDKASMVDIATAKLFITYIVLGAAVGFIIDALWKPGK